MRNKKAGAISSFIVGIIFMATGGSLTYFKSYPDFKEAKESLFWDQARGEILKSKVIEGRNKNNEIQYSAEISYSYQVNGAMYQSSQRAVGNVKVFSSSSKDAYRVKNRYPVGQEVVVYYSPSDVKNAVLEPGVNFIHYLFLGFGALFILIGLFIFTFSLFKIAVLATMLGVVLASLFGDNKKEDKKKTFLKNRGIDSRPGSKKNKKIQNIDLEINLDEEMLHLNKVSSTNFSPDESPWEHQWFLKGVKKDYGPYSFSKILDLFKDGKVKENHQCYSETETRIIKISKIINKKKGNS